MPTPRYVLITPARNEAEFIEQTVRSMVAQTVPPVKWIVVDDGSTDGTGEIVARYAAQHPWIEVIRTPERQERSFAGKVHAFRAGYERLSCLEYDYVGSLDADISFDPGYMQFLLEKLEADTRLGLAGTPFQEAGKAAYDYRYVNIEHVSGACQLFRRVCYEEIGGYVPVRGGCIDHIAVLSVRMKGWKTRTFPEKVCHHHRAMGTAQSGLLAARFKNGIKDHAIGNHPLWECSRVLYQMTKPPLVAGGLLVGCGYAWAMLRGLERPVSKELMMFQRGEQMQRLKRFFGGA